MDIRVRGQGMASVFSKNKRLLNCPFSWRFDMTLAKLVFVDLLFCFENWLMELQAALEGILMLSRYVAN